jgi:hypothetical protein
VVTTGTDTVCNPADPGTTVTTGPNAEVTFAGLYPAVYNVYFASTDNRYRSQTVTTQLNAAETAPPVVLSLDVKASTQAGTVFDSSGNPLPGAEVSVRQENNVETLVNDIDGAPLLTTSGTTGQFTFSKVPDGRYRVMVDAPGWNRIFSSPIGLDSAIPTTPLALRETTRMSRAVTVGLSSTAGSVTLVGAQATFRPVPNTQPPNTPANVELSGFTVTAGTTPTVSATQIPTGDWTLVVAPTTGAAFGPFETASFTVPAPDRGLPVAPPDTIPASPPVTVTRTLQQGAATITVSWPAGCSAQPATGTLPITLTRTGDTTTAPLSAAITPGTGGAGTATVTTALPPGDYSWQADPAAAGWTGGSGTFTVPGTGTPPIQVSSAGTLVPPEVPVAVSVTVDGSPRAGQTVAATPDGGGDSVTGNTTTGLCLAPGPWDFSIQDASAPLLLIPDRTETVTRAGPNTVPFTGFTFQPSVALATVAGRPADTTSRSVDLVLSVGGSQVWSDDVEIAAGAATASGPALIIGPGSYTLTGTPSGAAFGVGTVTGINPAVTNAATVTLPYTAVFLTVTVTGTGAADAVVTLTPATGTTSPQTAAAGVAVFRDIPAATYTVTATVTTGGTVTARGELTGQVLAAGSAPTLTVPLAAVP